MTDILPDADASYHKKMSVNNAEVNEKEMKNAPLHQLFTEELKSIFYTEHVLIEVLQMMHNESTSDDLKKAFKEHLVQTETHINRLETIFSLLNETPQKKQSNGIDGLIKEGEIGIRATKQGTMTRDVAVIVAAQKVEHYEMASYAGLMQMAVTMAHDQVTDILGKTLKEEIDTHLNLREIAKTQIYFDAEQEE